MAGSQTITITLSDEVAALLRETVESGRFGGESEVVAEALVSLHDRERPLEDWLRDEVLPAYDAWKADPGRELSSEEVLSQLRQDHEAATQR